MRSRSVSLTLAALAALTIAGSLYGNRDRYDRADFRAFYSWWSEYRAGIDPWQPSSAALKTDAPEHPISTFCDNTPGWVVLLSPFGALPERVSYWIWTGATVLSACRIVTPSMSTCTFGPIVSTGQSQVAVPQPVGWPRLPPSVGCLMPGAGRTISGAEEVVAGVLTVQLPT